MTVEIGQADCRCDRLLHTDEWFPSAVSGPLRESPYTPYVGTSRRRLGVILRFVVAAYVAALATLPFAHHDLACHLKTSTHCGVCHVGTSADDTSNQPALGHVNLIDAGRAVVVSPSFAVSSVFLPSSGRSPPATDSL